VSIVFEWRVMCAQWPDHMGFADAWLAASAAPAVSKLSGGAGRGAGRVGAAEGGWRRLLGCGARAANAPRCV
jgi:hypothetical protein